MILNIYMSEVKIEQGEIDKYTIKADNVIFEVSIFKDKDQFVPVYFIKIPKIESASQALLEDIRDKILLAVPINIESLRNPDALNALRSKIMEMARDMIKKAVKDISDEILDFLVLTIANEMLGLGNLDIIIEDENLEEIVINGSKNPVWVYHKKYGWLISNLVVESEEQIANYASIIGRRVGRQINILEPLMDASLLSGDRVNATLFPISSQGNTLTIRRFRKNPWTITDLIKNNTLDYKTASFLWLAVQYELSMIIAGGTASGKTTLLNVILPFVPPNERIISIEDTKELRLPDFLHWVSLSTRSPNPEGKGEVSMLDLMINSLRMRPDRIVVGEIRRQSEAEVLFEAINTGHSVYATLHANTAAEAFRRLTSPPINLPKDLVLSLPMFTVMFRQRKLKIRRIFEISEVNQLKSGEIITHTIKQWDAKLDKLQDVDSSLRIYDEINLFTGMTKNEIEKDLHEKEQVLRFLVSNNINTVNTVGKVISEYYSNKEEFMKIMDKKYAVDKILGNLKMELSS